MKFKIEKHEKYSLLTIENNKLTSEIAPSFKSEILMISKDSRSLICDLKNVEYIDSSGLSCFLIADRLYREKNLSFVLCNISDNVSSLIKLTKLDAVLTKIETLSESVDYVLLDDLEKQL